MQTLAHKTIVVDCCTSPKGSAAAIHERFPDVDVLALSTDHCYAAACNAGIACGSGEAIVLLDNDVIVPPRFLEQLLAPLAADKQIGSVAAVLLRPGEPVIDSAGLTVDRTLTGFPRLRGQPERSARTSRPRLLGPVGAAGAYRRAAMMDVGGLDEQISHFHEDLDLALRLCTAG